METNEFVEQLQKYGINFFTGVPDSLLKPLGNYLMKIYGVSNKHIIASNEGNCVAIAAGYHLATGKVPCVYMQNSGLGNTVNPMASLLNPKVYGIPCLFIIGWRGEPGIKDEPQHIFQGEITLKLLEVMEISYMVLDQNTTEADLEKEMDKFSLLLAEGKSVAIVVKKNGLNYDDPVYYKNKYTVRREEFIRLIVMAAKEDIIVSTTGKISRELFEIREQNRQSHQYDFLTVGSMGHSSSIALGIALNKPKKRVWCIDGDGSLLMHMGSLATIASRSPKNLIHVVINNYAHESVGGLPTVADTVDFVKIAMGCGYKKGYTTDKLNELEQILKEIDDLEGPIFIEVKSSIGSRENLGRPSTTPMENKFEFMSFTRSR